MSRPNPSPPPPARITVSYDADVEGAAEALVAILRHRPQAEELTRSSDHDETEAM
jgi:hypothetical protein